MQEKPNYYAILPAEVRYNQNISSLAKLLYAEITALTEKEGYAWATNAYFAKLYNVHAKTISALITDLVHEGYITVEIKDKVHRKIFISSRFRKNTPPIHLNAPQVPQKHSTRYRKNTDIIIQENNITNKSSLNENEEQQDHRGEHSEVWEQIKATFKQQGMKGFRNPGR